MHDTSDRICLALGIVALALASCDNSDDGPSIAAPTELVAMPVEANWVQLSWIDNSNNEEGFRIYRDDGGGSGFVELDTTAADYMGYSDFTITPGEYYTYYVVAFVGGEESAPSNQATVEAGEPYVTLVTPTDGETLTLGEMYDVEWVTNVPDLDAVIFLSRDGGVGWPPEFQLQSSWRPNGSPWPWKVGYKNTEEDPTNPPIWEQVITTTTGNCKLFLRHYDALGVSDWSDGIFTIQP